MPRDSSPPGNTGGKSPTVTIDWVSAVFSFERLGNQVPSIEEVRALFDGTVAEFTPRRGVHGYSFSQHSKVGNVCLAWGGNGNTVYLDIPGDACARVEEWGLLEWWIFERGGWLTRVDLAYDDFDGVHPVQEAVDRYRAGDFIAGGRPPKVNCQGNWIDPDGLGRTLYIGQRKNGKQLCVYEKGMQLGDPGSTWVRWEARFGNVDRVLPLDMLTRPREYLSAAYPALEFLGGGTHARVRVRKAQERIAVEKLTEHASSSYGGLVDFLMRQGAIAGDVVTKLRRDAVPRRLSAPTEQERTDRCNALLQDLGVVEYLAL